MLRRLHLFAVLLIVCALLAPASAGAATGTYDAVVIGAGPGGLMAALKAHSQLEAAGGKPKIVVVEKRGALPKGASFSDNEKLAKTAFARQQIIGLKPQVVADLAAMGIEIPARYKAKVAAYGKAESQPNPPDVSMSPEVSAMVNATSTHVIRINELQSLLVDAARKRGIKVQFGTGLEALDTSKPNEVSVGLRSKRGMRKVRAKWVIGGDGGGSQTRKLAGIQWIEKPPHGHMVGVWFKGIAGNNRIIYPAAPKPGESGVLLGDRGQMYGLFALPKTLSSVIDRAKAQQRELTAGEKSAIMSHCEKVAKKMLPAKDAAKLKSDYMLNFPISLNRAASAVRGRVIIIGDAVQTVNPYTGMGANTAMQVASLAGDSIVKAERSGAKSKVMSRYNRRAIAAAKAMHNLCEPLRRTFQSPSVARLSHMLRSNKAKKTVRRNQRKPTRTRQTARNGKKAIGRSRGR